MRSRSLVVAVIGVVTLALSSAPAAAAPVVLDEAQLESALLEPADIPDSGWEAAPTDVIEPEPHTQTTAETGGWCGGPSNVGVQPGAVTTLQKIASPDEPHWFIWETLFSVQEADGLPPAGHAREWVRAEKAAAAGCESWMTSGGEITNSISAVIVPFARVGKQRVAVEVTTFGDGVSEVTHVVYVRAANNVAVVHARILPADTDLLTQIVKQAVKKLKQAAAAAS